MVAEGVVAARARELPPGLRLGRYTLLRRIARGGMAELYLASAEGAEGFRKLVALKLVLAHLADDERLIEMFLDEARLAAGLDHPNIAQVIDLGEADGEHFMAMEYVHGVDLRDVLADAAESVEGGFPLECGIAVVAAACEGLDHAHERADEHGRSLGIVHRDVSPSNLVVRYDGCVKLVDFGIAKAAVRATETRTGMLKGKSGYMSPEQARGASVDRRSDVFGLGILLYEATTSMRLFYGDNEFAILNRIIDVDIDPPSSVVDDYPPELEAIVMHALAKQPHQRFATARQMRAALDDFVRAHDLHATPDRLGAYMRGRFGDPPAPEPMVVPLPSGDDAAEATHRRWRPIATFAVAGLALAAVGYFVGRRSSDDPAPSAAADPARATADPGDSAAPRPETPPEPEPPEPEPTPAPEAPEGEPAPSSVAEPPPPVAAPDDADPEPDTGPTSHGGRRGKKRKPSPKSTAERNLDAMMPRG